MLWQWHIERYLMFYRNIKCTLCEYANIIIFILLLKQRKMLQKITQNWKWKKWKYLKIKIDWKNSPHFIKKFFKFHRKCSWLVSLSYVLFLIFTAMMNTFIEFIIKFALRLNGFGLLNSMNVWTLLEIN